MSPYQYFCFLRTIIFAMCIAGILPTQAQNQFKIDSKITLPGDTANLDTLRVNDKDYKEFTLWVTNNSSTDSIWLWQYGAQIVFIDSGLDDLNRAKALPSGARDSVRIWVKNRSCIWEPTVSTHIIVRPVPNPQKLTNAFIKQVCACSTGAVNIIGGQVNPGFHKRPGKSIILSPTKVPDRGTNHPAPIRKLTGAALPPGTRAPAGVTVHGSPPE